MKDRPQRTSRVSSGSLLLCFGAPAWLEGTGLFLGLFSCIHSVPYAVVSVRCVRFFHVLSENSSHPSWHCQYWASLSSHSNLSPLESKRHDHSRWSWILEISSSNWGRTVQRALRGLSWSSQRKMEFCTLWMQRYRSQLGKSCVLYKGEKIIQILSFGLGPNIQKMSSSTMF